MIIFQGLCPSMIYLVVFVDVVYVVVVIVVVVVVVLS